MKIENENLDNSSAEVKKRNVTSIYQWIGICTSWGALAQTPESMR